MCLREEGVQVESSAGPKKPTATFSRDTIGVRPATRPFASVNPMFLEVERRSKKAAPRPPSSPPEKRKSAERSTACKTPGAEAGDIRIRQAAFPTAKRAKLSPASAENDKSRQASSQATSSKGPISEAAVGASDGDKKALKLERRSAASRVKEEEGTQLGRPQESESRNDAALSVEYLEESRTDSE